MSQSVVLGDSTETPSPSEILPDDVLQVCIQYLAIENAVTGFGLVSKRWHNVVNFKPCYIIMRVYAKRHLQARYRMWGELDVGVWGDGSRAGHAGKIIRDGMVHSYTTRNLMDKCTEIELPRSNIDWCWCIGVESTTVETVSLIKNGTPYPIFPFCGGNITSPEARQLSDIIRPRFTRQKLVGIGNVTYIPLGINGVAIRSIPTTSVGLAFTFLNNTWTPVTVHVYGTMVTDNELSRRIMNQQWPFAVGIGLTFPTDKTAFSGMCLSKIFHVENPCPHLSETIPPENVACSQAFQNGFSDLD